MKNKRRMLTILVLLLVSVLVVTACSGATAGEVSTPDPGNEGMEQETGDEGDPASVYPEPQEETTESKDAYPEPQEGTSDQDLPYPGPRDQIEPGETVFPIIPGKEGSMTFPPQNHKYAPRESDEGLVRGSSYIDTITVNLLEGDPAEARLTIIGNLPTPCHEIRVVVREPQEDGTIPVVIYTLQDPDTMCIQVLEPFEISVSLGEFTTGDYVVIINAEEVAEFSVP